MLAETTVDIFLTVAQVGIALVGFTGLVFAITRQDMDWSASEIIQLRGIVVFGIAAVFFAFLPLCLSLGELRTQLIWQVSSGVHGIGVLLVPFPQQVREILSLPAAERDPLLYVSTYGFAVIAMSVQISNMLGWPFEPNGMSYFIGILMPLVTSAAFFIRLTLSRIIGR